MKVWRVLVLVFSLAWTVPGPAGAGVTLDDEGRLRLFGDVRLRLESDWDSQRPDGSQRDDRTRARVRLRLGLEYDAASRITLGLRLRSGSLDSQQSPHVTFHDFDGNATGDAHVFPDRWYARFDGSRGWAWLGRNSFPFWKPTEFFWDDDVTPAGLAAGYDLEAGAAEVSITAAYLTPPDGGVDFHGDLSAGQIVVHGRRSLDWTAASGLYLFDGEPGAEHLRNGNGARDYSLWVTSLQAVPEVGGRPLTLSLDLMRNLEDYSAADPDPFTARHHDQTDGFTATVRWGRTKERGDWLVGYSYARIETLAVHASYAQDDWFRWGSATQTDSSDYRGHELRFAYAFRPDLNVVARFYSAEALTSVQDGNRFRLDLNFTF